MPRVFDPFDADDVITVKKNNTGNNKLVDYPVKEFKRILLEQNDDNVVWDRIFVPYSSMLPSNFESTSNAVIQPYLTDDTRTTTSGIYGYELVSDNPIWQNLNFSIQLPHGYKEGTSIVPVIHGFYAGLTDDVLLLELENDWNGVVYSTFNYTITSVDADVDYINIVRPAIANVSGVIGDVINFRFSRIVKDVGWTYPDMTGLSANDSAASLFVRGISFQYQKDTCGSNNQNTKVIGQPRTTLLD